MKLIELPKSPYWGANIHVGYYPNGDRKYSPRSSKVRRDASRVDENGRRLDKLEAKKRLDALQHIANEAMAIESDRIERKELESMLASLLRACGKSIAPKAPSWKDFARTTIERHTRDLATNTRSGYLSHASGFESYLKSHQRLSEDSSLADFRLDDIQAFYDWWIDQGGKSTTANGALKTVSLVFEKAVIADYLEKNPCKGVVKRDNVQIPKQPFTIADMSAITQALTEHPVEFADEWSLAIRFAIFTGARQSDCVALKWDCFTEDFRNVKFVPKKKERLHRLGKVDASVTLMLPEYFANLLKVAKANSDSEFVTPALSKIRAGKRGLGARFREILDLANVEYQEKKPDGGKGITQYSHTFHSFRHTLKTELRAAGVSDQTNHFVTGHDDTKVGERYIHERADAVFRECAGVFADFETALEG